jgi:hypothetical protein
MSNKLDTGDTNTRKGYIRSIIDAVEVDDRAIRIFGGKDVLQSAITGRQTENGNVRGSVGKWRARHDFERVRAALNLIRFVTGPIKFRKSKSVPAKILQLEKI